MRRCSAQTAVVFALQVLILSLVLAVGAVSKADADDSVLVPPRNIRPSAAGRTAVAPANRGGDIIPLPTPVKQPRNPRVPPMWSPFDSPGPGSTMLQVWLGAQNAWQVVAARVHAQ